MSAAFAGATDKLVRHVPSMRSMLDNALMLSQLEMAAG